MNLTEKYRPLNLGLLLGQDRAVERLRGILKRGIGGRALLFEGPSGLGKTSAALCVANELGLLGRDTYERIKNGFNWNLIFYSAGTMDAETTKGEFRDWLSCFPVHGEYKMAVVDEAQTLTAKAAEAMKNILETLPAHAVVIFTTTADIEDLFDQALRDRFYRVRFERPDPVELEEILRLVANRETGDGVNLPYKKIIAAAGGSIRRAVQLLEDEIG